MSHHGTDSLIRGIECPWLVRAKQLRVFHVFSRITWSKDISIFGRPILLKVNEEYKHGII
jgi:hypothetical protein